MMMSQLDIEKTSTRNPHQTDHWSRRGDMIQMHKIIHGPVDVEKNLSVNAQESANRVHNLKLRKKKQQNCQESALSRW